MSTLHAHMQCLIAPAAAWPRRTAKRERGGMTEAAEETVAVARAVARVAWVVEEVVAVAMVAVAAAAVRRE